MSFLRQTKSLIVARQRVTSRQHPQREAVVAIVDVVVAVVREAGEVVEEVSPNESSPRLVLVEWSRMMTQMMGWARAKNINLRTTIASEATMMTTPSKIATRAVPTMKTLLVSSKA